MKRIISIALLFTLATIAVVASAQTSFAKQFKGKDGYSCITISKAALRLMPGQNVMGNYMGINVGSVADKLDRLEIIETSTPRAATELKKACEQWIESDGFEDFIDIDEEGERTSIFIKTGSEQNVFLLLDDEKDGDTDVIILYGTMTLEEMRNIINIK